MYMCMHYRLTCRVPVVDTDVIPVWAVTVIQMFFDGDQQPVEAFPGLLGKLEVVPLMLLGNHKAVAVGHRVGVEDREAEIIFNDCLGAVILAKRAAEIVVHFDSRSLPTTSILPDILQI